jgi:hypothetical protein
MLGKEEIQTPSLQRSHPTSATLTAHISNALSTKAAHPTLILKKNSRIKTWSSKREPTHLSPISRSHRKDNEQGRKE